MHNGVTVCGVADIEPPVRRARTDSDTERRDELLAVRMRKTSMTQIDTYARKRKVTRADAVRALLRAGLRAEGEIK